MAELKRGELKKEGGRGRKSVCAASGASKFPNL
jgi:hypothetical protein